MKTRNRLTRIDTMLKEKLQQISGFDEKILTSSKIDDIIKEVENADFFKMRLMDAIANISTSTTPAVPKASPQHQENSTNASIPPASTSTSTNASIPGGYKTKTEDLRPKNEDPVKIVLNSLKKKGSNMILDQSRNKEQQDLRLSTNLTRVFVLYITLPNVQNEEPFEIRIRMLLVCHWYVTRMLLLLFL